VYAAHYSTARAMTSTRCVLSGSSPRFLYAPLRTTQQAVDQECVSVSADLGHYPARQSHQRGGQRLTETEHPIQARNGDLYVLPRAARMARSPIARPSRPRPPSVLRCGGRDDSGGNPGGTGAAPGCRAGEKDDYAATFSNYATLPLTRITSSLHQVCASTPPGRAVATIRSRTRAWPHRTSPGRLHSTRPTISRRDLATRQQRPGASLRIGTLC
jgi:hypothetical protein